MGKYLPEVCAKKSELHISLYFNATNLTLNDFNLSSSSLISSCFLYSSAENLTGLFKLSVVS